MSLFQGDILLSVVMWPSQDAISIRDYLIRRWHCRYGRWSLILVSERRNQLASSWNRTSNFRWSGLARYERYKAARYKKDTRHDMAPVALLPCCSSILPGNNIPEEPNKQGDKRANKEKNEGLVESGVNQHIREAFPSCILFLAAENRVHLHLYRVPALPCPPYTASLLYKIGPSLGLWM